VLAALRAAGTDEDWLSTLPQHQAGSIVGFLDSASASPDWAQLWLLSNEGARSMLPEPPSLRDSVVRQLYDFFCDGRSFQHERKELLDRLPNREFFVSGLTALVVQTTGAQAAWVSPFVVVAIILIGRMGIRAWCETQIRSAS